FSPLSGFGDIATTAPYGSIDHDFDIVELATAAGATFVARTTSYHVHESTKILKQAIEHKGFSLVEVMSQCPTHYGRKNRLGDAINMLEYFKKNTTPSGSKAKEKNPDLIERGIFVQKEMPEYCSAYEKIIKAAMQEK
ncbi:MAG: 2-oxoacid:ferredoxin oxidoreductase subunit beta, partial [Deltaproteobacteria bacterium]|nr:2-oxoacid:ferredoxin oxidoreductase subunit beta [Deltaproteobacteria bacterium]